MQFSSLQDVPALLSCCFKDGSERAENLGTSLGSETPRDLLSYFRVSEIPLCLTIRERWKGVRKKMSKTDVLWAWNRKARLCGMRRSGRPRFSPFDGRMRGGWFSRNVTACSHQISNQRSISLIASGLTASLSRLRATVVSSSATSSMFILSDAHTSFPCLISACSSHKIYALHTR